MDLTLLVAAELTDNRQRHMVCPAGCNPGQFLDSSLVQQQGDVQLLHLVRLGQYGTVSYFLTFCTCTS